MLFNSLEYILLLGISLTAYWGVSSLRYRQFVVLASSSYFYMSWSEAFFLMLVIMVLLNWVIASILEKTHEKFWLVLSCILNLGLLAYFKYMDFFLMNVSGVVQWFEPDFQSVTLSLILPLGISFYIFELIAYQVDIYRKEIQHEKNLVVFSIFILFFPQLIAGPICRAWQLIPQINLLQKFDGAVFYRGLYLFLCGFLLKSAIADGLAPYVNVIFDEPVNYSGFDNLMATIGFGIQILGDFWGYSLMALGAALMFGYELPHNFNLPYSAISIRDFWRRWHITLSSWLRDYLYIALGGSRTNKSWKVQRNLALTMLLGGLWHGASWNFVIWGAIHGGALAVNRWFQLSAFSNPLSSLLRCPPIAWFLTMSTVFVAWIFFRASSFTDASLMLHQIVMPTANWADTAITPAFFELILIFIPLQYLIHRTTYKKDVTSLSFWKPAIASTFLALFSFIYYVDGSDFIYFQF